jgi:hypothetical protein
MKETRNVYKILVGKPNEKKLLGGQMGGYY